MDVINYFSLCDHPPSLKELWRDKSGAKYLAFLEKGWGVGREYTEADVRPLFS